MVQSLTDFQENQTRFYVFLFAISLFYPIFAYLQRRKAGAYPSPRFTVDPFKRWITVAHIIFGLYSLYYLDAVFMDAYLHDKEDANLHLLSSNFAPNVHSGNSLATWETLHRVCGCTAIGHVITVLLLLPDVAGHQLITIPIYWGLATTQLYDAVELIRDPTWANAMLLFGCLGAFLLTRVFIGLMEWSKATDSHPAASNKPQPILPWRQRPGYEGPDARYTFGVAAAGLSPILAGHESLWLLLSYGLVPLFALGLYVWRHRVTTKARNSLYRLATRRQSQNQDKVRNFSIPRESSAEVPFPAGPDGTSTTRSVTFSPKLQTKNFFTNTETIIDLNDSPKESEVMQERRKSGFVYNREPRRVFEAIRMLTLSIIVVTTLQLTFDNNQMPIPPFSLSPVSVGTVNMSSDRVAEVSYQKNVLLWNPQTMAKHDGTTDLMWGGPSGPAGENVRFEENIRLSTGQVVAGGLLRAGVIVNSVVARMGQVCATQGNVCPCPGGQVFMGHAWSWGEAQATANSILCTAEECRCLIVPGLQQQQQSDGSGDDLEATTAPPECPPGTSLLYNSNGKLQEAVCVCPPTMVCMGSSCGDVNTMNGWVLGSCTDCMCQPPTLNEGQLTDFDYLFSDLGGPFPQPGQMTGGAGKHSTLNDEYFAQEQITATPEFLKVTTSLPVQFLKSSLNQNPRIKQLLESRRIFVVDHSDFLDYVNSENPVTAPTNVGDPAAYRRLTKYNNNVVALFAVEDDNKLHPVAIWVGDAAGEGMVWTPQDTSLDWLQAKLRFQMVHKSLTQVKHASLSHYLQEPFLVAARRCMSSVHPVRKFIEHHAYLGHGIVYQLDELFLKVSPNTTASPDQLFGAASLGGGSLFAKFFKEFNFQNDVFPKTVEHAGVDSIPGCHYCNDNRDIVNAYKNFFTEYFAFFYKDSQAVLADSELQAFAQEMSSPDLGRVQGFPSVVRDIDTIAHFLSQFAWTATAYHEAVSGKSFYDYYAHPLSWPRSIFTPPPTSRGTTTQEEIVRMLPTMEQAAYTLAVINYNTRPVLPEESMVFSYNRLDLGPFTAKPLAKLQSSFLKLSEQVKARRAAHSKAYPESTFTPFGTDPLHVWHYSNV